MLSPVRAFPPIICLMAMLLAPGLLQAQVFPRGNGIALSGLYQFDLYVEIADWVAMADDAPAFRSATRGHLNDRLTAAGLSTRAGERHYLVCRVQAVTAGDHVAYTAAMELWELRSTDVHTLLWKNDSIAATDRQAFNADRVSTDCADAFFAEWSRWNPAR